MSGKPPSLTMLTMNPNKGEQDSRFSQKDTSASEYSISSIASTVSISQDENFRVSKHAENSLRIMEEYLKKQQLTDVTLIAGKKLFLHFLMILSYPYDEKVLASIDFITY